MVRYYTMNSGEDILENHDETPERKLLFDVNDFDRILIGNTDLY